MNTIKRNDGESEFCGIYTFSAEADRLDNTLQKSILQIYNYLTDKNPQAQYILFCNKETTTEELTAFLYRAIKCDWKSCFIISGIEFLQFKQKTAFLSLLFELYTNNENKMKSCLIIAFLDIEADIIKSIFQLKNRKSLRNI